MEIMDRQSEWFVGNVKFFDQDKGFGFINCWDDETDYFVHITNVNSQLINDDDVVIFQLQDSRKKPGTKEACKVSTPKTFSDKPDFLKSLYYEYKSDRLKREILNILADEEITALITENINQFNEVETEAHYSDLKRLVFDYRQFLKTKAGIDKTDQIITDKLKQISSEKYLVKSWLEGFFRDSLDEEQIKQFIIFEDESTRIRILEKLDKVSVKQNIIESICLTEPPEDVITLVVNYLKKKNNTGYVDAEKKFNLSFWEGKTDYRLFKHLNEHYKKTLKGDELFDLYMDGYAALLPSDYIVEHTPVFTKGKLELIFEKKGLTYDQLLKVFKELLQVQIEKNEKGDNTIGQHNETQINHYVHPDWSSFEWIFDQANEYLTESKYSAFEAFALEKLPATKYVQLWEKGSIRAIQENKIADSLLSEESVVLKVEKWLSDDRIDKSAAIDILKRNFNLIREIKSRTDFTLFHQHLIGLQKLGEDILALERTLSKNNLPFYHLANWLEGFSEHFNYTLFKNKLIYLKHSLQIKFLKKLFLLAHKNEFQLTVEKLEELTDIDFDAYLNREDFSDIIPFDTSLYVAIEAIKSFQKEGSFLVDSDLLKAVLNNVSADETHRVVLSRLFEQCEGRMVANWNWARSGEIRKVFFGDNRFYYAIEISPGEEKEFGNYRSGTYTSFVPNPEFQFLKEEVKKLPGRKWNPENEHWGVPAKYEVEVLNFAREHRFYIHDEGSNYKNNNHLVEFERKGVPNGVTFCEGRLAKEKHNTVGVPFWWCCNEACFQHCETFHEPTDWENYTLLDFCTILGFDLNDVNRMEDHVDRGKYYQFISIINRFNRLLERLYCENCKQILYPVDDSHFSHYRVTRFHCENKNCNEFHNEIYLHHCLNGKCNGIIDSRVSAKCPNGLYICSNESCGSCCSNDMFRRRLDNLKQTGVYVHENLEHAVKNNLGHLERKKYFCYNCGDEMEKNKNQSNVYYCIACDLTYEIEGKSI